MEEAGLCFLFGDFVTDWTMGNTMQHHEKHTIWENMFVTYQASNKEIRARGGILE